MRVSVLSSSALGLALLVATCPPASARAGIFFAHGIGAHFHGGRGFEHRDHDGRNVFGGGIGLWPNAVEAPPSPAPAPVYVSAPQYVQSSPAARISEGPRIIVLDHRKSHKPRGSLPVVIYGDSAS